MFDNPFLSGGTWYKANLHAHTTASDGDLSPEDSAAFYRRAGYDILAITDHWHVVDLLSEWKDLLLLPGVEYSVGRSLEETTFHIVGLNVTTRGKIAPRLMATPQETLDAIRGEGGEAVLAHPYWSGLQACELRPLEGYLALEVYNTGCDIEVLRGYSMVQWDDLLTQGGRCGGLAVDDGHRHLFDHGGAWTMIRAEELSVSAVMEALRQGRYYASTGPELREVRVTDGRVRIETSPVASIAVVSTPGNGGRVQAPEGESVSEAEFAVPAAPYFRVEIADGRGRSAWSNPFLRE
jgi:hypothetical protein